MKVFAQLFSAALFAVVVVLVVMSQTVGFSTYQPPAPPAPPTQEELHQELVELLTGGALNEAIEESGGITAFLHDDEYDPSMLLIEPDARDEMKKYTRIVRVRIGQHMTEEELKLFLGVDTLPPEVLGSFIDDSYLVPLSEQFVLGVLVEDSVLMSLDHLKLAEIPPAIIDRIFLEVLLLPDTSVEDDWMSETLLSGGVTELVTGGHEPYIDIGLLALKRPEEQLIVVPENYSYEQVASKELRPLDRVVYLRSRQGVLSFDTGNIINTDLDGEVATVGGRFKPEDLVAPVFVLNDGGAEWVGVLINEQGDTATVLSRETLRTIQEAK